MHDPIRTDIFIEIRNVVNATRATGRFSLGGLIRFVMKIVYMQLI